jgi:hypothetical protein
LSHSTSRFVLGIFKIGSDENFLLRILILLISCLLSS